VQHRKHRLIPYGQRIKSGPVGSVLCNLFRGLLASAGVDQDSYSRLVERSAQRPMKGESPSSIVGLGKELMRESITWKTFLRGLEFVKIKKFEFIIALYLEDGRELHFAEAYMLNQITSQGVILSNIFKALIGSGVMDITKHSDLMARYLGNACANMDRTKRSAARASLTKELFKPTMTWKSFVKGMVYLSAVRVEITLKAYPLFGRQAEVLGAREVINLSDFKDDIDEASE